MPGSAATSTSAIGQAPRARRLGLTLALLAFAQIIISIDYNIVYVALPEIGAELGFSSQTLQWVISAYAVVFGGFLLLGGRACDLFGPRRLFVLGLVLYGVSSMVGGFATSPGLLIAARAVQGIGGALLFPATLTLVSTSFPEGAQRNRAFAVWGTAGGGGMILGSLLGGVLTQAFGWEAVFFVNVPLAVVAIALAFPLIAPDKARALGRKFDLTGALTATVGVTAVVFTLVQGPEVGWFSPSVVISAIVGVVLLVAFYFTEKHSRDPLMPLRLFRNRNLSTGVVVTCLYMASFGTLLYFLTVYFQSVHGYSALDTGMAFLVPMVAIAAGAQLGGRLATRFGMRTIMLASMAVGAVGALTLALTMSTSASYALLIPGLLILGLGQGAGWTVMFGAATTGVAPQEQGIASGMASTTQQIGGAVGLAILVVIANVSTTGLSDEAARVATTDGLRLAVFAAVVGMVATFLVALNFTKPGVKAEATEPTEPDVTTEKERVPVA